MIGNVKAQEQLEGQPASAAEPGTIFINRNLFSSYYLGTLLAREVRARLGETGMRMPVATRRRLHSLYERIAPTFGNSTSYTRTRQAWIDPLLHTLGYEPLEPARAADFDEDSLPDGSYLYRPSVQAASSLPPSSATEAEQSDDTTDDEEHRSSTTVLLSLMSWGTDFDRPFTSTRRRGDIPHKLMERLLAAGPAQWGLLCNGRRLRLLKRNVVAGRQQYFEVDLETLFENGSDRDFDTFWVLLRALAFQPEEKGRCLLDIVDEGSRKHAEGVSSTLKASVFRALELLMGTLVNRARELANTPTVSADREMQREQAAATLENLNLLYQQSLVLLYRLLFVLYAESRALLPTDNAVYRESYSLEPLRDEIMEPGSAYLPGTFRLWESIQALFRLIRLGCTTSQLVVPAYNGDLFSARHTALLDAIRVPDNTLSEVLRELSVTPPTRERGRERIDYQDLGVEQLGAVYEGLLEYEPKIAGEPMVEVRYKGDTAIIPAREQRNYTVVRHIEVGQFYLGHGAGRKTSGSYYTPQPLVDFLVRRTLGPLVQGRTAAEILDLKVVDPAMGSGAFLVGACLFLADAYARALSREQSTIEQSGTEIVEIEELADEQDELSDEATRPYRRLVAERCLYGVDINPMAVELAKVSLWLTTLAGDKPLTFLDANLRCGNSLIGAPLRPYTLASGREQTIDTIHPEANKLLLKARGLKTQRRGNKEDDTLQLALFEEMDISHTLEPIVGRRQWIAETPSDSVARVREKAALFHRQIEQDEQRRMLKTICDLWVATWFWHQPSATMNPGDPNWVPPLDGQIYRELVLQLRGEQQHFTTISPGPYLKELERITEQMQPFHWELEFPEVYFESNGQTRANPGFDAVLGNPPWDIIKPNSREFFSEYDPGFRELERVEAERRQEELLKETEIKLEWNIYSRSLNAQVDYIRFSEVYPYQSVEIKGKQTGGDANTYKLFLERSFKLLRPHGSCGIILPSGLYTDQGCTGLRQLFLSLAQISHLLCFENRRGVFPIHSSFKFVLFGFRKQPAIGVFEAAFMLHDLDVLANPEEKSVSVPTQLIQRFSPDTLSFMEFRSQRDVDIITRIYGSNPLLGETSNSIWRPIFQSEEFHMTHDRELFNENGTGWPLYEGKMIYQYTPYYEKPRYWVDPNLGRNELARAEIRHVEDALDAHASVRSSLKSTSTRQTRISIMLAAQKRGSLTSEDVCIDPDSIRLAIRKISASTNERTFISAILPSHVFASDSLYYLVPWYFNAEEAINQLHNIKTCYKQALPDTITAYLCGVLNSFTLDYVLRFKINMNATLFHIYQLPVPRLAPNNQHCKAIAYRVARLVCIGPEFDDLRHELLGSVEAHVATNPIERQRLQNEIDVLVAHLYGLSEEDLRHILFAPYTFPLVKHEVKDGVMAAFARGEEMMRED